MRKDQNKENIRHKLKPDPDGFNVFEEQVVASQIPSSYFELEQSLTISNSKSTIENFTYVPPKYRGDINYYTLFWKSYIKNESILNEI